MTDEQYQNQLKLLKTQREVLNAALKLAPLDFKMSVLPPSGIAVVNWYEEISDRIKNLGEKTFKKFLVASPDIVTILQHSRLYQPVVDYQDTGIYQTGTLENLLVFVDPFFPTNSVLLGTGSLDDPENLVVRDPIKVQLDNILDAYRNNR